MREPAVNQAPVQPLLVTIPHAGQAIARGVTKVYELISQNELVAVKSDNRTLVTWESLRQYTDKLAREHRAVIAPRSPRKYQGKKPAAESTAEPPATALSVERKPRRRARQQETEKTQSHIEADTDEPPAGELSPRNQDRSDGQVVSHSADQFVEFKNGTTLVTDFKMRSDPAASADQIAAWVKALEAEAADVRRQLVETHMSERERVSKKAYVEILSLLPQLTDAELEQVQARNSPRRDEPQRAPK